MLAEIITIGDELLIGQVCDTNSAWISVKLNESGFKVASHRSVPDDEAKIADAVTSSLIDFDIVILTGGLGPTSDDKTRDALCMLFNDILSLVVGFGHHFSSKRCFCMGICHIATHIFI